MCRFNGNSLPAFVLLLAVKPQNAMNCCFVVIGAAKSEYKTLFYRDDSHFPRPSIWGVRGLVQVGPLVCENVELFARCEKRLLVIEPSYDKNEVTNVACCMETPIFPHLSTLDYLTCRNIYF